MYNLQLGILGKIKVYLDFDKKLYYSLIYSARNGAQHTMLTLELFLHLDSCKTTGKESKLLKTLQECSFHQSVPLVPTSEAHHEEQSTTLPPASNLPRSVTNCNPEYPGGRAPGAGGKPGLHWRRARRLQGTRRPSVCLH